MDIFQFNVLIACLRTICCLASHPLSLMCVCMLTAFTLMRTLSGTAKRSKAEPSKPHTNRRRLHLRRNKQSHKRIHCCVLWKNVETGALPLVSSFRFLPIVQMLSRADQWSAQCPRGIVAFVAQQSKALNLWETDALF